MSLKLMSKLRRCQILLLRSTKFNFGWGSAPDPDGGAYSAPPHLLAGFRGAYFYWEGKKMGAKGGRRERERGGMDELPHILSRLQACTWSKRFQSESAGITNLIFGQFSCSTAIT